VFFEQLPQQDSAGKPLNKGWELVSGIQIKALKPIIFICIKEGFFLLTINIGLSYDGLTYNWYFGPRLYH
jgi:hypothetical protein